MPGGTRDAPIDSATRRELIRTAGAGIGAAAVGWAGLAYGSESGFALDSSSFTASDVRIESRGGQVGDVTVDPTLRYAWDGFDAPPQSIAFLIEAKLASQAEYQTVASEATTVGSSALEGSDTYDFQNGSATAGGGYSLLETTDGSITANDFEPETGTERTRTVELRVTATLTDVEGRSYTSTRRASYTVTVIKQRGPPGNGGGGRNRNGN